MLRSRVMIELRLTISQGQTKKESNVHVIKMPKQYFYLAMKNTEMYGDL